MIIHVVKPGDTIYKLSNFYGVPVEKIISDNAIINPNELVVGQTIVVITNKINYTVEQGDSLYSISQKYQVSLNDLKEANPNIVWPYNLNVGQTVVIPVPNNKLGDMEVNGYAFPNINMQVLEDTLPHLTYLSIFSYQVSPSGNLTNIDDASLINKAKEFKVAPMMVITNLEEEAGFSSDIAHEILTNTDAQNNLINNIINVLQTKGYYGLDIDFEYVYPQDKENYNKFLERVVNALHPLGFIVTTALAPKVSENQPGLLYEAHDYKVHGQLADHVIIMTYEWGYTYGEPQAVAPIGPVKQVLNYATSVIPPQKILMGMPNYGYDWQLPFEEGTAATVVGNVGAVDLAREKGSEIMYSESSQAPYFNYYTNTNQHVVWFDDARSIAARLKLVNDYNLGGVSYWTINRYFPQMWLVQDALYNTVKVLN